jgi:5-methylcytosine-specific restriction endonuclease McrA
MFEGKAEALHNTDKQLRSAGGFSIPLPSVIRMLFFVKRKPKRVALTKKNVLLRDDYKCGYCSNYGGREMTVDHVIPRALGGKSTWENLISACSDCNGRKRDRTPEQARMPLLRKPREPRSIPWIVIKRNTDNAEWWKYLALYNISIEDRVTS